MAFGTFEVHGGDFKTGSDSQVAGDDLHMKVEGRWRREKIPLTAVAEVEVATEESTRRWGLGAAGLVLLGPLGLLGALATKKKVTFLTTLKDGRKFLATANQKVYQTILGATI